MRSFFILFTALASLCLSVASASSEETAKGAAGAGVSSGPTAEAAVKFGAIAFSPKSGAEGYGENYKTREDAEKRAMTECTERSEGKPCDVVSWCQNACCALAVGKGNGWGGFWGATKDKAEAAALEKCSEQTTSCKIRRSLCVQSN